MDAALAITSRLDWTGWITIVVFIAVFVVLIREVFAPEIAMLGGASILVICGVLTPQQFLSGFSRDIIFTLGMLCVIGRAMYINGILTWLSDKVLPKTGGHRIQLAKLMVPVSIASAFLNNTPIVLMLTGVVRRWALSMGKSPSKYLIPLSMAAIFGGMCTLIGTSVNLVVNGLLREFNPLATFNFFELALLGLPCMVVFYAYILTVGYKLLPDRKEPEALAKEEMREFTCEFIIEEGCPLIGRTVSESSRLAFPGQYLIEIGREGRRIESPSPAETFSVGDRLVFVADVSQFAQLSAIRGLQSLVDPQFELDLTSPHFSEVVVAVGSSLVGETVKRSQFRSHYGASVVAVYRQGGRVTGLVGEIVLHAGDTLLLLSNRPWRMRRGSTADLYPIEYSREVPVFVPKRAALVLSILALMVLAVTLGAPILVSSLSAVGILLVTRTITLRQARRGIDWNLLLLVASAFGLGFGLYITGVADLLARGVLAVVGSNRYLLIGGLFLLTMLVTELITNAAAALMIFPIALEAAKLAGYDSLMATKAIGVTVAIAASSSFLTPIGYQTNTIVYGPGGYRFIDYARVGFGLTITQLILATAIIPNVWPLA